MTLAFILLATGVVLEFLVHMSAKWPRFRNILAVTTLIASSTAAGALVAYHCNIFTLSIAFLSLYRIFNMVRIVEGRMHVRYLRNATRTTSISLVTAQLMLLATWGAWSQVAIIKNYEIMTGLMALQLIVALLLATSVLRTLRKTTWPAQTTVISPTNLPTVTVAIPARNETVDLQECLRTLVASDYPKLEIIVLDDCSQLRRTPEIIREFAQQGVRFVPGMQPLDTWLPKNQAYERLAKEASGEYILFCGVDMRFDPPSIRQMITAMLDRNKQMLCILPRRDQSAYGQLSLLQAMRYWWELVPPRRLFNRPPVLSSSWLINHADLVRMGSFASVARSITPEAHFAKQLAKTDSYSFLRATGPLGVYSVKHVSEQRDTAVRTRYPQLHRRPEQVALLTAVEFVFLLLPFGQVVFGQRLGLDATAHIASSIAAMLLIVTYVIVARATRVNNAFLAWIGQPLAVLADIVLLHYSMFKYEFSTVEWRGRNICIPMMHVVPHLPGTFPGNTGPGHQESDHSRHHATVLQTTFQERFNAEHELVESSKHHGRRHRRRHHYRHRRHSWRHN